MTDKIFLQKIKKEFPGLKWKYHKHVTHGFDHDVILLDSKIVFRFPKSKEGELEMQNEISLLSYLKPKIKVAIPFFIYFPTHKSFAGYKMLKGLELKSTLFKRLTVSEEERVAEQIAGFITAIHKTPKAIINKYHIKTENILQTHNEFVNDTTEFLFPRLNKKEIQYIQEFFSELESTFKHKYENVLTHNDLTWSNIIWNPETKAINIIDFGDRSFTDPACDFACLWEYGNKFTEQVYELYQGKKDEGLLHRSQLYFKRIPLFDMKDALTGFPVLYKNNYKIFRQRFKI